MFNGHNNNIKIDGNGNITLQDIEGSPITINYNDKTYLNEIIKHLPHEIIKILEKKRNEKSNSFLQKLLYKLEVYNHIRKTVLNSTNTSFLYINQNTINLDDETQFNILNYILNNQDFSYLLLGNSGLGKTRLALKLFYEIDVKKATLPLLIDLKQLDSIKDVHSLIVSAFIQQNIWLLPKEAKYLLENHKIFFIIDGFDEIGCRSDIIEAEKSLKKILEINNLKHSFFLSCRNQYFNSIQSVKQITDITNLEVHILKPWTKIQIIQYVNESSISPNIILDKIFSIYNLNDLCSTPLLLSMVIESLKDIEETKEFNSSSLYEIYIKNWLEREDSNIIMPWTEKEEFIYSLSWKMYIKDVSKIHFKEIEKDLTIQFRPNFSEKYYLSNSVRTRSFLIRDNDGYYFFQHRSFMEFLVAQVLIKALRTNDLITFGAKQVYHEISIFMRGLIIENDLPLLMKILKNEKSNEIARFHAANLLVSSFTVLSNLKFSDTNLLIFLKERLADEKSIMVSRQLVYVICFMIGNEGAINYLNRLKKNYVEDELDTFFALNYFGKNLDDAINGHLRHLRNPKYHNHLIMDLYHLGKIARNQEIKEIEEFCTHEEELIRVYAQEAVNKIKSRHQ